MRTAHHTQNQKMNNTSSTSRRGKTPSFSSILLDSIYRSMDLDVEGGSTSPIYHIGHQRSTTTASHKKCQTQPQYQKCSETYSSSSSSSRTKTQLTNYNTASPNTTTTSNGMLYYSEKPVNLKRAIMIEHWIEKYQQEEEEEKQQRYLENIPSDHRRHLSHPHHANALDGRPVNRQKSVPNRKRQALRSAKGSPTAITRSSSSSPESFFNSGLGTYSSAAAAAEVNSHSCFTPQIPLKIRTTFAHQRWERSASSHPAHVKIPSTTSGMSEGKFMARTRSRALKMYGDLKNTTKRQPQQQQQNHHHHQAAAISPGAKIASFLSSMFAANKKHQPNTAGTVSDSETTRPGRRKPSQSSPTTTSSSCSSGSSFSRSCLSTKTSSSYSGKTPTAAVKSNRSVRFYPVSVIMDEDLQLCGHKCLKNEDETTLDVNPKEICIRSLVDSVVKSGEGGEQKVESMDLEEETGDGEESCTSSDLFELNNLNSVGVIETVATITCGEEELPVYGTTSWERNRAIAGGFVL